MLKTNEKYAIMDVMDTSVVIGKDASSYQPYCLMSLNKTGAFLWKQLEVGTDEESLAQSLVEKYSLSLEKAKADVADFLHQLREKKLLSE